ncbi:hypothetical protein Tco_1155278, partial [Tanacetum coccineum]
IRVASRSSSPTTSTLEIPTAPIPPVPSAIDIPIGRLYRTHPGGPCRALTARKSVRPLHSHRLALRYTSHHLDHFTFGSSSDHSSFDHSSVDHSPADHTSGHSTSDQSLSKHTSPDTTIVSSSSPSRFIYLPPTRTLRASEAYHRWRSAPLSTMSPTTTMHSSIPALGALVPTRANLLLPRKRFRDSYSSEDSVEEDIDADVLANIEADTTAVEVAADIDVEAGVDADIGIEIRDDIEDEDEGEAESSDRGTIEVRVDVVAKIDIQDAYHDSLNMTVTRSGMTSKAIEELIAQRVAEALATYEANCTAELGNGNRNGGGNGNGNPNRNNRGAMLVARECTYHDFVKCQTLNFKGTEGVVGLTWWFEKIETIFHISNCPERYQVKYATCTLLNSALTWWNEHKRTIRVAVAFAMSWRELMKLMTEVYYPRNEIQKMETEL